MHGRRWEIQAGGGIVFCKSKPHMARRRAFLAEPGHAVTIATLNEADTNIRILQPIFQEIRDVSPPQ